MCMPSLASEGEQRRAAERLMREGTPEIIDDITHMGISLTDGVGFCDPNLLSYVEENPDVLLPRLVPLMQSHWFKATRTRPKSWPEL